MKSMITKFSRKSISQNSYFVHMSEYVCTVPIKQKKLYIENDTKFPTLMKTYPFVFTFT